MFAPYGEAMLLSPRYGSGSLADVVPSLLARLGVDAETDRLGFDLDGVRRVCLLMVDGLGAEQLAAHPQEAPFLNLHRAAITAASPLPQRRASVLSERACLPANTESSATRSRYPDILA